MNFKEDFSLFKKCFECSDDDLGDLWVSPDRRTVEWLVGKGTECRRRFTFNSSAVVRAGFTKFENLQTKCLIIVLRELAYVYYIANESSEIAKSDSSTICFPFPIKDAFMYQNGIILERDDMLSLEPGSGGKSIFSEESSGRTSIEQQFISLSDPLAPFGTLVFINEDDTILTSSGKRRNTREIDTVDGNILFKKKRRTCSPNEYTKELENSEQTCLASSRVRHPLKMMTFPKNSGLSITVLYDSEELNLQFYYTRILGDNARTENTLSDNKNSNSAGQNGHLQISKPRTISKLEASQQLENRHQYSNDLRKLSLMNRKVTPNAGLPVDVQLKSPADFFQEVNVSHQQLSSSTLKRNDSSTMDRLGINGNESLLKNHPNSSVRVSSSTLATTDTMNSETSIKDVVLTKISTVKLPESLRNGEGGINIKCLPLKYENMEGVLIFDTEKGYYKLWFIDMIPEVINSNSFLLYGTFPQLMIQLKNLPKVDFGNILDFQPTNSSEYRLDGCVFAITEEKTYIMNPYLDIYYEENIMAIRRMEMVSKEQLIVHQFPSTFVRYFTLYDRCPKRLLLREIFFSFRYICDSKFYQLLVFFWFQISLEYVNSKENLDVFDCEWECFKVLIFSLMSPDSLTSLPSLRNSRILNSLERMDVGVTFPKMVMGLHLLREETILNIYRRRDTDDMGSLIGAITTTLEWPSQWDDYYQDYKGLEAIPCCLNLSSNIVNGYVKPLDAPTSILGSLSSLSDKDVNTIVPFIEFSRLVEMDNKINELITPRTFKVTRLFESLNNISPKSHFLKVLTKFKMNREDLQSYPPGLFKPMVEALQLFENNFAEIEEDVDVGLISRADLARYSSILKEKMTWKGSNESALKTDIKASPLLNAKSTKSILSVLSDIVLSSESQLSKDILLDQNASEDIDDGVNLKKNSSLIFSEDRRFNDAMTLLSFSKVQKVPFFSTDSEYSKILSKKKKIAEIIALRSCAQGIGWAMVVFATEKPLSTQKWVLRPINFSVSFPDETVINVDKDLIPSDIIEWGEFHAGVSSGLKISRKTKGVNGSWIVFNKPKDVNASHAGFLLGLGLNGHLKELEEWHIYNYLSLKNTHVGVGLLLGMTASMRGTMDLTLTKILSIHIASLLPKGANDLNIDIRVQTAGLVSLGLLFLKSQHKKMTNILVDQLESLVLINEEYVANEGYRMAAGIAIGMINLGAADNFTKSCGTEEHKKSRSNLVEDDLDSSYNLPEMQDSAYFTSLTDGLLNKLKFHSEAEKSELPQNSYIGRLLAIMLIYLKSENSDVADQVKPKINFGFERSSCRPEFYMFSEFAYRMIMWDSIHDSVEFLMEELGVDILDSCLKSDHMQIYYILSGRILSLGLKFASTGNLRIKEFLLSLFDQLLPFYQYPGRDSVDFKLVVTSINVLLNVIMVSLSMVMSARGDLDVFKRIRYVHEVVFGSSSDIYHRKESKSQNNWDHSDANTINNQAVGSSRRSSLNGFEEVLEGGSAGEDTVPPNFDQPDTDNHYAKYIATSLSIGFLFLGSGQYALKNTDKESVAYLILSTLPLFLPPYYLQELRHFWSLAVESRCLLVKDANTDKMVSGVDIRVLTKSANSQKLNEQILRTPCLLPEINAIKAISLISNDYYPLHIDFSKNISASKLFKNGTILYVQSKKESSYPNGASDYRTRNNTDVVDLSLSKKIEKRLRFDKIMVQPASSILSLLHIKGKDLQDPLNEFEDSSICSRNSKFDLELIQNNRRVSSISNDDLAIWWKLYEEAQH